MSELHFLSELTGCFAQPVDENPIFEMANLSMKIPMARAS
jgi:hypothetical protein